MWNIFDAAVFAGGFVLCWFCKDKLVQIVTGAESFAKSLEVKAKAIRAAL